MSQTANSQMPVRVRRLYELMDGYQLNDHPALDALDWLLYRVADNAPRIQARNDESDEAWNGIKSAYAQELATFQIKINMITDVATALYPLTQRIFSTARRFAEEVARSNRPKDVRMIETCILCTCSVNLTDKGRRALPGSRFVPVHSHCYNTLVTRVAQIVKTNNHRRRLSAQPAQEPDKKIAAVTAR